MKPYPVSTFFLMVLIGGAAGAQGWSLARPDVMLDQRVVADSPDTYLLARADRARQSLELSFKDYVVAFDTRYDSQRKRLGLPLLSLADDSLNIAYDPGARNVMARWRISNATALGAKLQYQAYLGEAGSLNFVFSSRF